MKHYTRFRAYQLGTCGASFSLSVNNYFILIEARYNDVNSSHILWELNERCEKERIDLLHITSWDADHCNAIELERILDELKPLFIEYPSYAPHTDNAQKALKLIQNYHDGDNCPITPARVKSSTKEPLKGVDVFYNPLCQYTSTSNDKSIIKFFRIGSFTVLSLGDCEETSIRDRLINDIILKSEVDVLILAHHGADNGFTTSEFLEAIKPKVAICASDYGNKYGHPDSVILQRLREVGVDYYSTKTGDVVAQSIDKYTFKVSNYCANNTTLKNIKTYENKTWYIID